MQADVVCECAEQEDAPVLAVVVEEVVRPHADGDESLAAVMRYLPGQGLDGPGGGPGQLGDLLGGEALHHVLPHKLANRADLHLCAVFEGDGVFSKRGGLHLALGEVAAHLVPADDQGAVGLHVPDHEVAPLPAQLFRDYLGGLLGGDKRALVPPQHCGVFQVAGAVVLYHVLRGQEPQRVRAHQQGQVREALDVVLVVEVLLQDDVHHAEGEGAIGAGSDNQDFVGLVGDR